MRTFFEFSQFNQKARFLRVLGVVLAIHLLLTSWMVMASNGRTPRKLVSITVDIGANAPAVQQGLVQAEQGGSAVTRDVPLINKKTQVGAQNPYAQPQRKPLVAPVDKVPDKELAQDRVTGVQSAAVVLAASAVLLGSAAPAISQGQTKVSQEGVRTFEPDLQAAYKDNPKPAYPKAAFRLGVEGTVDIAVEVNADGSVSAVKVAQSSGNEWLDQSALDTVKTWRFRSARKDGALSKSVVKVPITFRLRAR